MAGSINKTTLIGNVGKQPDVRSLNNGSRVCNLSLATSESWRDKQSGERREKTEWHRVVIFNDALITLCEKYITKGTKLYVEGQLETRKFTDQAGIERYTTEVVLRPYKGEMQILSSQRNAGTDTGASAQERTTQQPAQNNGEPRLGSSDYIDDNLPDENPFGFGGGGDEYGF